MFTNPTNKNYTQKIHDIANTQKNEVYKGKRKSANTTQNNNLNQKISDLVKQATH